MKLYPCPQCGGFPPEHKMSCSLGDSKRPRAANAWEHAASMLDKHANSDEILIRLTRNGDRVVGAFCGDPFAREVVRTGDRYETYDPDMHAGKRSILRVMLNFYVPAARAMKVVDGGTVWFKDVLRVREKYGLDNWLFEIKRYGYASDPKPSYTILPEKKIDAVMRDEIDGIGLHDLAALVSDTGWDCHTYQGITD